MAEPITFGAVMQGLGALTSVTGGVLGFGQAAKQKAAQQRAERESNRLMQQARRNLQTKFYEQLQVPTEAYDRQFRESTAQQQQSLQALRESDPRTLAAGVGKVGAVGVAENQNGDYYGYRTHAYIQSTSAVNFFKIFTLQGGNLDSGTVTLYGYEK